MLGDPKEWDGMEWDRFQQYFILKLQMKNDALNALWFHYKKWRKKKLDNAREMDENRIESKQSHMNHVSKNRMLWFWFFHKHMDGR